MSLRLRLLLVGPDGRVRAASTPGLLAAEVEVAGERLAIVKQFVEAQGGSVSVEGEPGRGSRFVFRLPTA